MTDARADSFACYAFALAEMRAACQRECKTDKPITAFEALTWWMRPAASVRLFARGRA